jgi:hypothetical protein
MGIDLSLPSAIYSAYFSDDTARDRNVGRALRSAGSVDNGPAADHHAVLGHAPLLRDGFDGP